MLRDASIFGAIAAVALLLAAASSPPNYSVSPQSGLLAATGVTGATSLASASTIFTMTGGKRVVIITNTLDTDHRLTWGGVNGPFLPARQGLAIDLGTNNLQAAGSVAIGVYAIGPTASTGRIGGAAF